MNQRFLFHSIVPLLAAGGLCLAASQQQLGAQDTLFMESGEKRPGKIIALEPTVYRLQVLLSSPSGAAPVLATVSIPKKDVTQIEFGRDPEREKLLAGATPDQLPQLADLWQHWEPFLAIAKAPAGKIGTTFGNVLLASGTQTNARKALDVFTTVENTAWNEEDRMAARQGRLRAMIATGNAAAAVTDALALAKLSEDPAVLIEAKYILAEAADKQLRKLLEDNPRWEEDIHVIPERNRLYHEALDKYLFAVLFFGSHSEEAARGLWGAIGVYKLTGEQAAALECARDLLRLYPQSKYAERTQAFVNSLPKSILKEDPEQEAREEFSPKQKNNS
jgi:hypothetical protein